MNHSDEVPAMRPRECWCPHCTDRVIALEASPDEDYMDEWPPPTRGREV